MKDKGVLFLLYMKVIMMKVFDLIIFGYVVKVFFKDVFIKYVDFFKELDVDVNNGFGDVFLKIESLDVVKKVEIEVDI